MQVIGDIKTSLGHILNIMPFPSDGGIALEAWRIQDNPPILEDSVLQDLITLAQNGQF
jgi:hypothetical protein